MHLQDSAQEVVKKRRRATKKPYSRSIVGATLEVIQKRRSEKPEVRDAAREAALRYNTLSNVKYISVDLRIVSNYGCSFNCSEIKERIKKTKDEKKAKKAEVTAKKSQSKVNAPRTGKGPKLGGGGGKR